MQREKKKGRTKKNISLIYFISIMRYSWFWLGTWIFYHLMITDYAGIGLIEAIMITTVTLTEIPTGAIADLLGKKKTLSLGFLLLTIGGYVWGTASDFTFLTLGIFLLSLGGTLNSGTLEALLFDSLKEIKKEKNYDKIISRVSSIQLITMAVSSLLGGFMHTIHFRLPFYAAIVPSAIGLIATFFLTEPKIDTEKFSFDNFILQTKQGISQLTQPALRKATFLLLSISLFIVIAYEMLNDILAVEFGFNGQQLSIFIAVVTIVSALISPLSPWLQKKLGENKSIFMIGIIMALSLLFSPMLGLILGGLSIIIRFSSQILLENITSTIINNQTLSKYRATTLSTFNMIKNLPYIITAVVLGSLMDQFSGKIFAFWMGGAMLILLIFQGWFLKNGRNVEKKKN